MKNAADHAAIQEAQDRGLQRARQPFPHPLGGHRLRIPPSVVANRSAGEGAAVSSTNITETQITDLVKEFFLVFLCPIRLRCSRASPPLTREFHAPGGANLTLGAREMGRLGVAP